MQEKNMIFLKKKHVIPKQGGGGGSPTWEKFPHFPVFFGGELPLGMKSSNRKLMVKQTAQVIDAKNETKKKSVDIDQSSKKGTRC